MLRFTAGTLTASFSGAIFGLFLDPNEEGPVREMNLVGCGFGTGMATTIIAEDLAILRACMVVPLSTIWLLPVAVVSSNASSRGKTKIIEWYHQE